jgi:hypothetical protein
MSEVEFRNEGIEKEMEEVRDETTQKECVM